MAIRGLWRRMPDCAGIFVSLACGVHCLTLTLLFLFYPALWLNRRYWEAGLWKKLLWVEWGLLAASVLLALTALSIGYARHRRATSGILAICGLLALVMATLTPLHFAGYRGGLLALAGGLAVATGHWLNIRALRSQDLQADRS